jgi:hypothetical protein
VKQLEHMQKLCRAICEMNSEAPHDLCGEQREFYLPRLRTCLLAVGALFPAEMAQTFAPSTGGPAGGQGE